MGGYLTNRENHFISFVGYWLNTFHIQVFTFASGYLFYYIRYEKNRYTDIKQSILKRAKRLLVPYALVSLVWAIPAKIIAYGWSWEIPIKDFGLAIAPAQLWFLPMLFILFVLFSIASDYLLAKKTVYVYVALYIISSIVSYISRYIPLGVFQISSSLQFALFYYAGMMHRKGNIKWCNSKMAPFGLLIASLVLAFVIKHISTIYVGLSPWITCALLPLTSYLGILSVVGMGRSFDIDRFMTKKSVAFLQKNSVGIYLFHQQFIYLSMRIFNCPSLPDIIFVFLNFVFAVLCSLLLIHLVRKLKVGRIIIGENPNESA